jgi:hypothetical protein
VKGFFLPLKAASASKPWTTMALPAMEEGKVLSEALNTVKIQVQQMKRHLVRQLWFLIQELGALRFNTDSRR